MSEQYLHIGNGASVDVGHVTDKIAALELRLGSVESTLVVGFSSVVDHAPAIDNLQSQLADLAAKPAPEPTHTTISVANEYDDAALKSSIAQLEHKLLDVMDVLLVNNTEKQALADKVPQLLAKAHEDCHLLLPDGRTVFKPELLTLKLAGLVEDLYKREPLIKEIHTIETVHPKWPSVAALAIAVSVAIFEVVHVCWF